MAQSRKSSRNFDTPSREDIVALKKIGFSGAQISRKLGVSRMQVSRTLKRFEELGHCGDRPRSRVRTVRTKHAIKIVRDRVRNKSGRSVRTLAKDLRDSLPMSKTIVHQILPKDLGLNWKPKSYRHLLSAATKAKRKDRVEQLLRRIRKGPSEFIWTDEKVFTVEPKLNRRTDGAYAKDHSTLDDKHRFVGRHQKPAAVMVWAGVTTSGKKSPLVFVEQGVKINSLKYVELLEKDVFPWLVSLEVPYVFMQDDAPAHTSQVTQNWCKHQLHDFLQKTEWPPSSPDLNPMDFSVWGILNSKVGKVPYPNVKALKADIVRAWEELPEDTVRAAVAQVPTRLQQFQKLCHIC